MKSTDRTSAKELFVLGRLASGPAHGHEIMRTLSESHSDAWVELSQKHVYYILKKLEERGSIAPLPGSTPRQKVYTITPAGRETYREELIANSAAESIPYSDFDTVFGLLAYTDALSDAEKERVLRARIDALEERVRRARTNARAAEEAGAPELPSHMFGKIIAVSEAEITWLEEVLGDVARNGWPDRQAPADAD